MAKSTRTLPGWNGVAAGATATLVCPIGLSYHEIITTLGGTTFDETKINEIRIVQNGKPTFVVTGTHLDVMNQYEGITAYGSDKLLALNFDRPLLKTRQSTEMTAVGTGAALNVDNTSRFYNPTPLSTFTIEMDIDASASAPTLSSKAIQSGGSPLGAIIKRRRYNQAISGAGTFEVSDLPRGDAINKIWIFNSNVTRVTLTRDNFISFDRTLAENTKIQNDGKIRVPQSGLFVIDPSEMGNGTETLVSNVQDFRLAFDTSGADNLIIYVDYIGGLGGQ